MRNVNRIKPCGIWVAFLIAALVLTGCTEKPPVMESDNTGSAASAEQETHERQETKPQETKPQETEEVDKTEIAATSEQISVSLENLRDRLAGTAWHTWSDSGDETVQAISFLDLYGGEQSAFGDYDGEATLIWLYDGDGEYQETYEGWWRLEEVDEQICLRLDLLCNGGVLFQGDENPQRISDLFPLLWDAEQGNLALYKGVQNGTLLPFHSEQSEFAVLMKSVG